MSGFGCITGEIGAVGAVVEVELGLTREEIEHRRIDNRSISTGFRGRGVIDTGAEASVITGAVVQALAITPVRHATVLTTMGQVRAAAFTILVTVGPGYKEPPDPLPVQAYEGLIDAGDILIGRDILNLGELVWKGQEQRFSLSLPRTVRSGDA